MIGAFFVKDFRMHITYKLSFILEVLGIFFFSFVWFYIAKIVNPEVFLDSYGVGYYSYVILGFAFFEFVQLMVNTLSNVIRDAQTTGVLESILVTPISITTFLGGSLIYPLFKTILKIVIYLLVAVLVFGVSLASANWLSLIIIVFVGLFSFIGLGALVASITIVTKQNFSSWFTYLLRLISNLFYPLAILPLFVQDIAKLLPVSVYLDAIRLSLFQGAGPAAISSQIISLGIFAVVLLPLGFGVFYLALKYVKKTGSLIEF